MGGGKGGLRDCPQPWALPDGQLTPSTIAELAISAASENLLPHCVGDLFLPCGSHLTKVPHPLLLGLTSHNSPWGLCCCLCLEPFSPRQPVVHSLTSEVWLKFTLSAGSPTALLMDISPSFTAPLLCFPLSFATVGAQ